MIGGDKGQEEQGNIWTTKATFIEGDIDEEMILGYSWLAENDVMINARKGRLTVGGGQGPLFELIGWPSDEKEMVAVPTKKSAEPYLV